MGRELISKWLQQGDELLIGNIKQTLYAIELKSVAGMTHDEVKRHVAHGSPWLMVLELALKAIAPPPKASC